MNRSEHINDLAAALAKAQASMDSAKKDSKNPFFNSKYADLASVVAAIKEPFGKNELSYTQCVETDENNVNAVVVVTLLMHSSGQWVESRIRMFPTKNDPQGVGSAITYARRYALQSMAGIPAEDDDGNAASGNPASGSAPAKAVQPRPAAAAVKRDEEVKAAAKKSVAKAIENAVDSDGVVMSVEDLSAVMQQMSNDEMLFSLASLVQATNGARKFYRFHEKDGTKRAAIIDGEILTEIGSVKDGAPVPAWLDHIRASETAWPAFCTKVVRIRRELGMADPS